MTLVKKTQQKGTDIILIYDMSVITEVRISPMPYNKGLGNLIYCELHYIYTSKTV